MTVTKATQSRSKRAHLSLASGPFVFHEVKKEGRTPERWRKESNFSQKLQALATLPPNDKLDEIDAVSERLKIPEIWRRARLSLLEHEFMALTDVLISSTEKQWIPVIKEFLKDHGWKADLRGRPKLAPENIAAMRRGPVIDEIARRLGRGFELKEKLKKKKGYTSDDECLAPRIGELGYERNEIKAILKGRTLASAACIYYKLRYEPEVFNKKTILNSYQKYRLLTTKGKVQMG